jgi:hypothetical protein
MPAASAYYVIRWRRERFQQLGIWLYFARSPTRSHLQGLTPHSARSSSPTSSLAMVRFKNRHLLVEFLTPGQLTPTLSIPGESQDSSVFLQVPNAYDEDHDEDDEEDVLPPPALPFLPSPGVTGRLEISDEAGGAVYRAVRKVVQDVFGDEGWGRVASSFKGEWDQFEV